MRMILFMEMYNQNESPEEDEEEGEVDLEREFVSALKDIKI